MDCTSQLIDYKDTGAFSAIVLDYINGAETLRPFYQHPISLDGIASAILQREAYPTDRGTLVKALKEQYHPLPPSEAVNNNLALLEKPTTFTITTAHQPNIFTGHLYFIYKILHAIKLAEEAKAAFPAYDFVPVYFMGSEDADLDELGHIYAGGETLTWETQQKGAVGRMSPKGLEPLVRRLEGQFGGLPHGAEMASLIREAYLRHPTIQDAKLWLVHALFETYGLVVLIPDSVALKRLFVPLFRRELEEGFSHKAVAGTIEKLGEHYKVQAAGRDLNLFYLKDDIRNRIVRTDNGYTVVDTDITFTDAGMAAELEAHPDRFSPNVILRGVFQELVLPGVAFIGGGGELAYWLELKEVFRQSGVPYPVLVLRNSFLLIRKAWAEKSAALNLPLPAWFAPEAELVNRLVRRDSTHQLSLAGETAALTALYEQLSRIASAVDVTLAPHVAALQTRALEHVKVLEKKILKAEKRHFEEQKGQIHTLRAQLFPNGGLQERVENVMPYYAEYGQDFIACLYRYSLGLEAKFCILTIA